MYDKGRIGSQRFDVPVISIGNLSTGGTGKTPMTEYLIELIHPQLLPAVVSRGYGRKTKGFIMASGQENAETIGDEPYQIFKKFPQIPIGVCESRLVAIPELISLRPETQVILLDDAFQHRSVKPDLSILLSAYNQLYYQDELLPAGNLREPASSAKRADIIVVTKCPPKLSPEAKNEIRENINPSTYQHLYFSYLAYDKLFSLYSFEPNIDSNSSILLLTAIADANPLLSHLQGIFKGGIIHRKFADHHRFTEYDIESILDTYRQIENENKAIITTFKDTMRLLLYLDKFVQNKVPIYVQNVKHIFFEDDQLAFEKDIHHFLNVFYPPILPENDNDLLRPN